MDTRKPMVVVIDSGALYDPMADGLTRAGVPVFRSADRALRALNAWSALAAEPHQEPARRPP